MKLTRKQLEKMQIVSIEDLNEMIQKDEKAMNPKEDREVNGLLYSIWSNKKTGELFGVRVVRTVHMGFNCNDPGTEERFAEIVEREGACAASWGVEGRTKHMSLGYELAGKFKQYRFEIDYESYGVVAYKN